MSPTPASPLTATPTPSLRRQYPHVDGVADWRAQQTIRLLWDRIFDLEARLRAVETTNHTLLTAANAQAEEIAEVRTVAAETYALAQQSPEEIEE